jgi:glycosyltransferase involved in cell wall biosynthesis
MKVKLIYRFPLARNFSIENVFNTLIPFFKIRIEKYTLKSLYDFSVFKNLKDNSTDIYHITGSCNYVALALPKGKTVLTIHDIGHYERSLSQPKKSIYKLFNYTLPLKRVGMVTVVSEFTREKVLSNFKIKPEKVVVIPNPIQPHFKPSKKAFNVDKPTILQIGSGKQKNIENLIEAVKGLSIKLLLIRGENKSLEERLNAENIEYEWLSHISHQGVYEAYCQCDMLYFASDYEGFGLPIIEAMAVGRSIITSNFAPMSNLGKDVAWLVNPKNPLETKTAILDIIANESLRNQRIEKGLEQVKQYYPEGVAQAYETVYKSLINEN